MRRAIGRERWRRASRAVWRGIKSLGSLLWAAIGGFQKHNVTRMAASIAFFGILSLAPLGVILVTVGTAVFGRRAAEGLLMDQLTGTLGENAAQTVQSVIASGWESSASVPAAIVAALVLVLSATRLIGDIRGSLNTIWEVPGRAGGGFKGYLVGKVVDVGMILALVVLMLATLGANTAVNAITHHFSSALGFPPVLLQLTSIVFSLFVAVAVLALFFRVLPNVSLSWKEVGLGAVLSAVFFTLGNYFLGFYLARTSPGSVFGAAGSFVVIMIWVYYSAVIVLFGVEIVRAHMKRPVPANPPAGET